MTLIAKFGDNWTFPYGTVWQVTQPVPRFLSDSANSQWSHGLSAAAIGWTVTDVLTGRPSASFPLRLHIVCLSVGRMADSMGEREKKKKRNKCYVKTSFHLCTCTKTHRSPPITCPKKKRSDFACKYNDMDLEQSAHRIHQKYSKRSRQVHRDSCVWVGGVLLLLLLSLLLFCCFVSPFFCNYSLN